MGCNEKKDIMQRQQNVQPQIQQTCASPMFPAARWNLNPRVDTVK
ncbi:575_t:CDS:2 [Funneliformis caledonium]|uniref:575_t:CDS:1 n=1 Tax=Funneliformis caledonium TaxID=1117310 RepID=A0A9N8W8F9_9GLOM|nr:575_t:CDS:2 [Funneliformis caledonium]